MRPLLPSPFLASAFILSLTTSAFSSFVSPITLRSLGLKGDGITDETAAFARALNDHPGTPLDGEGLTYAINGTSDIRVSVDLSNLTLKQIAKPFDTAPFIQSVGSKETPKVEPPESLVRMVDGMPYLTAFGTATYPEDPVVTGDDINGLREMLNRRVLFITGKEGSPISIKLNKVKIDRGNDPTSGMHSNSAGLYLVNASPVTLTDVEISGDGKGCGLLIHDCKAVKLDRVYVHDIIWAPYKGDLDFTAKVLGEDFGWNNSPIYDFDGRSGRFMRVRIQEQTNGLVLTSCEDVTVVNSRIENVGTKVEGKFIPWQADGMTISAVKNLTIKGCIIKNVWEGIDFTGRGVDGFVQENIHISDTFSYGFKYAHPQKNGKVINCVSERAGMRGYTIGSECHNIEFINCVALETGANTAWKHEGKGPTIIGFSLDVEPKNIPTGIVLRNCSAINKEFPNSMEFAFSSGHLSTDPAHGNLLVNPTAEGASRRPINDWRVEN